MPGIIKDHPTGKRKSRRRRWTAAAAGKEDQRCMSASLFIQEMMQNVIRVTGIQRPQLPFWLSRWKEELLLFLLLAATFAIVSMAEVLHSHFLCPGRCSCISRIAPCPINCIRYRFSQSFSFTRSWVPCFFRDFLGSWGEMLLPSA